MVDFLVNLAFMLGGVLRALADIGGLLFLLLTVLYIYEDRKDGNLFWFLPIWDEDEDDNWRFMG